VTPTTVVNIRDTPRSGSQADCLLHHRGYYPIYRPSKWGNPYKIGVDGDRAAVIEKFQQFIAGDTPTAVALREALPELQGRRLVCFCAPEPCHGDILAAMADEGLTLRGVTSDE
jgi:hypothetical protein